MVGVKAAKLAAITALVICAAADKNEQVSPTASRTSSHELSTRTAHSITGHIIFQSETLLASSIKEEQPTEFSGSSNTELDASESASEDSTASVSQTTGAPAGSLAHAKEASSTECLASGVDDWDQNLQVSAVFIILVLSFLGATLPMLCKHVEWLRASTRVFTVGKFFGAGAILATAFVHMLGESVETLGDQCLEGKMGDFDSWPALLAMLAILAMHLLEHVLMRRINHPHHAGMLIESNGDCTPQLGDSTQIQASLASAEKQADEEAQHGNTQEAHQHSAHVHAAALFVDDERRRRLSTYILELGIALHSIIVGMTLAVTGGPEFKTLLAAISFHQFFEGMALGTRISSLNFRRRPLLSCLFNASIFALTTPLGQVIGIGIRQTFAPRSPSSLLTIGILDSLSAGILMYSAIVNLLVEEFAALEFNRLGRNMRIGCFCALYAGCASMSVIGIWA
ncbi:hypothetical protein H4R20_000170 [Coemansia guatemalensis]|uniref:Zinc/iron permease n=1 Tax=Coemansia guatemalensis TaxID=2761395 RepID=A0A9W8I1I7_9FUNG|nr:hypothetical protein H4R20_000170 [Coemansia guatemalensis]